MAKKSQKIDSVDDYIGTFPKATQALLREVREAIKAEAPGASEKITYKMPTYDLNGKHLVFFSGWKNHISLYPIPGGPEDFRAEFVFYRAEKSTLQFPIDQPLPLPLIRRIVRNLVEENMKNASAPSPRESARRRA